jgi:hypothetical protein
LRGWGRMARTLMPDTKPVDTRCMESTAAKHRPDTTPAAGAMESLERVLGEHWGRVMWVDACRRAGVSPRAAHSVAELRRIAAELTEVPGPAAVIGRTLVGQITVYEGLTRDRPGA